MIEDIRKKEITAMNDKMFKNIMKTDSGQRLLKGIIEETIGEKVDEMIILNPELKVPNKYIKGKNVDLFVKSNDQRIFIEINNYYNDNVKIRNFSYIANQYSNDYKVGSRFQGAVFYYQININRKCDYEELSDEYYVQSNKRKYIKNLKIIEYNMEKILDECYNGDVRDKLYLYLSMIIANFKERSEIIRNNGDEVMEDFSEKLMNMNEDEYYKGWLSLEEDNAYMDKLEAREFGKEEGRQEGKKQASLSIAKNMLLSNEPIDKITKFTGLSKEEIEKLK